MSKKKPMPAYTRVILSLARKIRENAAARRLTIERYVAAELLPPLIGDVETTMLVVRAIAVLGQQDRVGA